MTDNSPETVRDALVAAATAVIDNQGLLTKADQDIGDGDHGVGMARGFKAFVDAIGRDPRFSVSDMLKAGGQAMMMTSGGASGVIFGTLFTGAAKPVAEAAIDGRLFASALAGGLDAVRARGKAGPGDKTMVDALAPAVAAARARSESGGSLRDVADAAATGAEVGLESTKDMVATTGKAKSLGERSRGFVDPGALTLSIFLRSFERALSGRRSDATAQP